MKNGKTNAGRMLGAVLFGSLSLTGCFHHRHIAAASTQAPGGVDYTDLKQVNEIAQIVTSRTRARQEARHRRLRDHERHRGAHQDQS